MMMILFPSEGSWSPALHSLPAACLLLGRLLVLLFVNPGSDDFRSDTAPAVYPCKGDGRKVFAGHCICCTKLRPHFLAAQAGVE